MNISENKKRKLQEGKVFEFHGETYSALGQGEDGRYTVDQLLDVIGSYGRLIERSQKEDNKYAVVVLDDILKSVQDVLKRNNYSGKYNSLLEAPYYELSPRYDARKSFYGKAHVDTGDNDDKNRLWSYDTLVAEIKDGKPVVYGTYSATTLRHIKDWLKQNGFKAETAKQIMQDYGVDKESLHEGWRGSDVIDMDYHGDWADPDLVYDGYTFNYWDIEDALWDMFLEDTGYSDRDSGNLEVEEEFNQYIRDNAPSYLDDVIAAGYFDGDSRSWHDTCRN
jgi:hypothetical protein